MWWLLCAWACTRISCRSRLLKAARGQGNADRDRYFSKLPNEQHRDPSLYTAYGPRCPYWKHSFPVKLIWSELAWGFPDVFLASLLSGRASGAQMATRKEQLFSLFFVAWITVSSLIAFSWVSKGPCPLKETQTVKKNCRQSTPGSPIYWTLLRRAESFTLGKFSIVSCLFLKTFYALCWCCHCSRMIAWITGSTSTSLRINFGKFLMMS